MSGGSRVEIEYCVRCRFLLRAAWVAQELLAAFEDRVGALVLIPGRGGIFEVRLDGEVLYSRAAHGELDLTLLKRALRDRIAPGVRIGHED
jgi:selenoprotein W-related protein